MNFYIAAGSSEQVEHCYITGGSSKILGMKEALEQLTDLEVEELNPLDHIHINLKKNEAELDELISCGAVALGLAMRSIK